MEFLPLFLAVIPLLIALHKTEWGLWVFIFMIPGYALRVPVGPAEISMIEIAAVLLMPLLLVTIYTRSHFRRAVRTNVQAHSWHSRLLAIGILFFVVGLFVSLTQSNDIMASLGIIRGWVLIPIVFALLFGIWMRRARIPVRFFVSAFVISGVVVALVAPFWDNAWSAGRLRGFYESPNYLAMYLAPLLPLIAWYAKEYWRRWFARYIILGGLVSVLIAVLFSFSHGAWLGIGGGLMVALFLYGRSWARPGTGLYLAKRNWGVLVFGGASFMALVVVALQYPPIRESLQGAFHSRLGIWEATYEMLSRSPLWGIGAGMFQTAFMVKKHFVLYPVPVEVALHPHNIFLATWLYGGILGFVGFLGIIFATGIGLYKKLTKKVGSDPTFYGALAISFVIILVHGMVDTTYWKNDLAFMWWILIAFLR